MPKKPAPPMIKKGGKDTGKPLPPWLKKKGK